MLAPCFLMLPLCDNAGMGLSIKRRCPLCNRNLIYSRPYDEDGLLVQRYACHNGTHEEVEEYDVLGITRELRPPKRPNYNKDRYQVILNIVQLRHEEHLDFHQIEGRVGLPEYKVRQRYYYWTQPKSEIEQGIPKR